MGVERKAPVLGVTGESSLSRRSRGLSTCTPGQRGGPSSDVPATGEPVDSVSWLGPGLLHRFCEEASRNPGSHLQGHCSGVMGLLMGELGSRKAPSPPTSSMNPLDVLWKHSFLTPGPDCSEVHCLLQITKDKFYKPSLRHMPTCALQSPL